jgi:hypothetical protein
VLGDEIHVVIVDLIGAVPGLLAGVTGNANIQARDIRLNGGQEILLELAALLERPLVTIGQRLILENTVLAVRGPNERKGTLLIYQGLECL